MSGQEVHDFAAQEPPAPVGRHYREPRITPALQAHNADLAKKAASRAVRKPCRQNCVIAPVPQRLSPPEQAMIQCQHPHTLPVPQQLTIGRAQTPMYQSYSALSPPLVPETVLHATDSLYNEPLPDFGRLQPPAHIALDLEEPELQELEPENDNENEDGVLSEHEYNNLRPVSAQICSTPVQMPLRNLIRRAHMRVPSTPILFNTNKENFNQCLVDDAGNTSKRPHEYDPTGGPEGNTLEGNAATKRAKLNRVADLSPGRRRIIERAFLHFRSTIATSDPFPDDLAIEQYAIESWNKANQDMIDNWGYEGLALPVDDELTLIKQRASQLRGEVKKAARAQVLQYYKFRIGGDIDIINYNRNLVATLLDQNSFIYKDPFNRGQRETMYRSSLILDIICAQWFSEKQKSEGIRMKDMFGANGRLPLEVVALVLTAIRGALDEWKTGQFEKIQFTAKAYQAIYDLHLVRLKGWKVYTSEPGRSNATDIVQFALLQTARAYAGVTDTEQAAHITASENRADYEADE